MIYLTYVHERNDRGVKMTNNYIDKYKPIVLDLGQDWSDPVPQEIQYKDSDLYSDPK